MGRRDYAILLLLAKLSLRADEVATLTLDDIDWRASEILVRAKGRQRARMPIPPDIGAAIVAYLRNGGPKSTCRRLFVRTLAPHVGFASGCAITMIAKAALDRVGIEGCAHRGAHIFRHSLATELLRSGASLSEIGQLLRHENHDTTRIYAKVDIDAKRAKAYVYSDAEIDALLTAALALPPADGLRRWTHHTLFGLIAVTGMRISEAMGLERDDVDVDAGVLTVRLAKFGKSRPVPLHPTTRTALRDYAHRRDALLGSRCGSTFFVSEQGGRLLNQYVHRVFWRLSREIGLRRPGDRTGPRVHDFRHRFAIRTLLDWYREGKDVEQQLPMLSTYLGRACVRDTYWYLSACPELMEEAARRLDRRWEVTP